MSASGEMSRVFKIRGPLDPVADQAICVARPELEQLMQACQAPTVDAYLAILSSRQTGKTTLLYQLRSRLRPRGFGLALIDLGVVQGQTEADLYHFVAGEINSELERQLTLPRRRQRQGARLPSNPLEFRTFLLEIARRVHAPRLVILIDEVEAVSGKSAEGFFGAIRNVFSSRRKEDESAFAKYLFVVSGATELHRLSTGPTSPLNIAERIYLQDLSLEGVDKIVANFERAAISAPAETAQWIYDQTRGHPYLTQKLCVQVEMLHPGVITPEIVQRASVQLLRSDDHLEKMLMQIDAESQALPVLEQITNGKSVTFSRLQPSIARLELLGAIRDAGHCAIRNPIYYAAFRTRLNAPPVPPAERRLPRWSGPRWLWPVVAAVALLILLLNVPFMYNYVSDIHLATRSINDRFVSKNLGGSYIIHYDRVLRANSPGTTNITVDQEGSSSPSDPVLVTFLPSQTDLTLDGAARRTIDVANQQVRFVFGLNQSGLRTIRYNPFEPATDHRQVTLTFQSATDDSRREVYTADFVVDYFSDFVVSAVLSFASFLTGVAAIFAKLGRFSQVLDLLRRPAAQES